MSLVNQIRNSLAQYVAGKMSLKDFQEQLDQQSTEGDLCANTLASAIEWAFCDHERGLLSAEDLQGLLGSLLADEPQTRTSSAGVNVTVTISDCVDLAQAPSLGFPGVTGALFDNSSFDALTGPFQLAHR